MKKLFAIILVIVMTVGCLTACGSKQETVVDPVPENTTEVEPEDETAEEETAEPVVIELGNSGLTIAPEKAYVKGEISEEDTDENQVAYYKSEETLVDFDVYEWAKATDETLTSASTAEAAEYDATAEETEINGFAVAFYNATEESDGEEYETVTYMIDNDDEFVEIVFWLDGENAQAEVDAIMATLAK